MVTNIQQTVQKLGGAVHLMVLGLPTDFAVYSMRCKEGKELTTVLRDNTKKNTWQRRDQSLGIISTSTGILSLGSC